MRTGTFLLTEFGLATVNVVSVTERRNVAVMEQRYRPDFLRHSMR
jgi:hypothetical protein